MEEERAFQEIINYSHFCQVIQLNVQNLLIQIVILCRLIMLKGCVVFSPRYDQSSPGLGPRPTAPGLPHTQGPPDSGVGGPMYAGGPRFPGPQYPSQAAPYQVPPGSQYSGYPQQAPPAGPYSGPPRPGGPMFGTPNKRFPDEHTGENCGSLSLIFVFFFLRQSLVGSASSYVDL